MRETALLIPRSREGGASLQPVVKTMLKHFPLQSTEVHGEAGLCPATCPNARADGCTLKVAVQNLCTEFCTESVPQQAAGRSCDLWGRCDT